MEHILGKTEVYLSPNFLIFEKKVLIATLFLLEGCLLASYVLSIWNFYLCSWESTHEYLLLCTGHKNSAYIHYLFESASSFLFSKCLFMR